MATNRLISLSSRLRKPGIRHVPRSPLHPGGGDYYYRIMKRIFLLLRVPMFCARGTWRRWGCAKGNRGLRRRSKPRPRHRPCRTEPVDKIARTRDQIRRSLGGGDEWKKARRYLAGVDAGVDVDVDVFLHIHVIPHLLRQFVARETLATRRKEIVSASICGKSSSLIHIGFGRSVVCRVVIPKGLFII